MLYKSKILTLETIVYSWDYLDEYWFVSPSGRFTHIYVILNCLGHVLFLGRAPRTKETLLDFRESGRVTRHSRVFRRVTGCQGTPGFWGVTMCLFMGSGFLVSHRGLRKPRHFYGLSPLGTILTIIGRPFTQGRIYPFLLIPDTCFFYHFIQSYDSVGCCPIYRAHQIKHQTQCRFSNHALTPI